LFCFVDVKWHGWNEACRTQNYLNPSKVWTRLLNFVDLYGKYLREVVFVRGIPKSVHTALGWYYNRAECGRAQRGAGITT
jgi:hypothetical protein